MNIPFFDFGGRGLPLHFLHANGYPPNCYKPLFELLQTQYRLFGMLLRPLWEHVRPEDTDDWYGFSRDLLHFLTSNSPAALLSAGPQPIPVIGVGHSIGAMVTLRAALRDPAQFRALVLLDPVLFIPRRLVEWKLQRAKDPRSSPLIEGALRRRRLFKDLESAFRSYRQRDVFRYMTDENLRIYIEGITRPSVNGGYELLYSPEWEARIYFTSLQDFDIWNNLEKLKVPALFLRGAETDTFLEEAAALVKQKQPGAVVEALDKSTHLLPLERPQEVLEIIRSFLKPLESAS